MHPFFVLILFISMEQYKQIADFPDYEISNTGNVRNTKTHRILKTTIHKKRGYVKVGLRKDNKTITCEIHRLVAMAFLSNPNKYEYVDHLDRNKLNNNVTNLMWVSKQENLKRRIFHKPIIYYCDITDKFVIQKDKKLTSYNTPEMAMSNYLKIIKK